MKKLIASLSLLLVLSFAGTAQAQNLRYYYYPASNVYYDLAQKQYLYPAGTTWTRVTTLPANYKVAGAQHVTVYSQTPEVWQMNAAHKTKYKKTTSAPKGKAVGYKGSNGNKGHGNNGHGKAKGKGH